MTVLHTGLFIHDPVDLEELWEFTIATSLMFDDMGRTRDDFHDHTEPEPARENTLVRSIAAYAQPPVSVCMWYRENGAAQTEEETDYEHKNCPNTPSCEGAVHAPPHHVLLGLATDFEYTDSRGWNVGDLHAAMIWAVGGFLNTKGVPWSWTSELTDRLHTGEEAVGQALDDLREAGRLAPIIARRLYGLGVSGMPTDVDDGGVGVIVIDASQAMRMMFGVDDDE